MEFTSEPNSAIQFPFQPSTATSATHRQGLCSSVLPVYSNPMYCMYLYSYAVYCISRPSLQPLGRQHFALGLPKAARPEKYKEIQIQSHPEKQDPSGAISNHNCCSSYFAQIHLFTCRHHLGKVELKICPFFWNIPSGPTHPQHLLSICLNPSLVSF